METKELIEQLKKRYGIPKVKGKTTGYDLSRHPLIEQALYALLAAKTQ